MAKPKTKTTSESQEDALQNSNFSAAFGPGDFGTYPANQGVPWSAQVSNVTTIFRNLRWYLVSNMRQPLSEAFSEIGLIQTIVQVPVDDALRGGFKIKSKQLEEDQVKQLQISFKRDGDLETVSEAGYWMRLFGGAGVVIVSDQKSDEPLNVEAINKETPLTFVPCDMWELFWSFQNTSEFSQIIDGNPLGQVQTYNYYGQMVDKSRVLTLVGMKAPSFVRPRLRGWGLSVVERLVRSINQYLKATDLGFEVLDEFKIDVYKLKGLATTLASPTGRQKAVERTQTMNYLKNYQNALVMDAEDDFDHKQLSFAGLAEVMEGIRMQVASDMRMPITKLFGTSASKGFSTDQNDMEVYNSMVEGEVRSKLEPIILKMLEIKCQREYGFIPDDLEIEFRPLRELSAEQVETVKTSKFARLIQAKQAGEITRFEFREGCNAEDLLPITLDNAGDELNEFDPDIEEKVAGEPDPLEADDTKEEELIGKSKKVENSNWDESKHPRDEDGKFGQGSTSEESNGINEHDLNASIDVLQGNIKDKDWDSFIDTIEKESKKAKIVLMKPEDAKQIKKSHNLTYETDPDNEKMHKANKHARGKDLKDPSVLIEINGELYALDGQHRLNKSIKDGKEAKVAIIDGKALSKFGITEKTFEGKKKFNSIMKLFNSLEYDKAAFEADGGSGQFQDNRQMFYEDEMMKDRGKFQRAKEASQEAFGSYNWQFCAWKFRQLGGKLYGGKSY